MTASIEQIKGQVFDQVGTNRLGDLEIAAEFAYRDMERLGKVLGERRGHGLPAIALMDKYLFQLEVMRNILPNLNPEHMLQLGKVHDYRMAKPGTQGLEDLLHDVHAAFKSGVDSIEIHGIRTLNVDFTEEDNQKALFTWNGHENCYGELPATAKAVLDAIPLTELRRSKEPVWVENDPALHLNMVPQRLDERTRRIYELRKNAQVSTNATTILQLLQNRGMFNLLETDPLYDELLLRLVAFEPAGNVNYMEDEPVLFVKLSHTYQQILNEFKDKVPPCVFPFLDDVFMRYAQKSPRWQDGPGCYGPIWKGSELEQEGVAPQDLFRPGSGVSVLSRYAGMEEFHEAEAPVRHVHDSNSALHDAVNHGIATELNLIAAKVWHGLNGKTGLSQEEVKMHVQKFLDNLGTEEEIVAKMARIFYEQEHPTESFASTAQEPPLAEKFNSVVKGVDAVVPDLLREVINELGMLRRELKSPPGVKWGLDSFLCEPGIATAHRGSSITVSLPRGDLDSIESVESKLTEGSLGVYELLVNGKPGRLMVDLSAYPANEAHAMFHDFRKAWGAYWDRKTMEEQKLGREE